MPLARVGQSEEIEIVWRPFELRPEPAQPSPYPPGYRKHLFERDILPLARELGVTMAFPPVSPSTRLAHQAAAYARTQGKEGAMVEAIFKAYFQDGRDIGQVEVLADVGLTVGIDPVGLKVCLQQGELREAVVAAEQEALRRGIHVVPYFVFDGKVVAEGLQTESELRRVIGLCRGEGLIQLEE